ncbi:MAG: transposase [Candidatus Sulfotelmatobacter sp.]
MLALENPCLFYDLLFTASAQTWLEIAIDRKHMGAEIGVISILHTWGQNLFLPPHIHFAIPAGGLSPDHCRWIRPRYPFFLPLKVLSRVLRGKFLAGLKRLHCRKQLCCAGPAAALADPQQFAKLIRRLHRHESSMPSPPSADPCRCCPTLAVTPTAWPFPIIAYWPSTKNASPFAGRITPMAASMAR